MISYDYQAVVHCKDFNVDAIEFDLDMPGSRRFFIKPAKALWTSTWKDKIEEIGWIEWCLGECFQITGHDTLYKIIPKRKTYVYTINSWDDWFRPELIKAFGNIDYIAMKEKGYDGIHFTEKGSRLGHTFDYYKDDRVGFELECLLSTVDCESTVWLNKDWIGEVIKIKSDVFEESED